MPRGSTRSSRASRYTRSRLPVALAGPSYPHFLRAADLEQIGAAHAHEPAIAILTTLVVILLFTLEIQGALTSGNEAARRSVVELLAGRVAIYFYGGTLLAGLIVPLIQIIMFGMGPTLALADFTRVLAMPWPVVVGIAPAG